jgi:hypothetical protein
MIAAAERLNSLIGGCYRPPEAPSQPQLHALDGATLVMVSCSVGAYSFTDRLFLFRNGEPAELVALPDYDGAWIAADQASLADLDADAGVLTTHRKSAGHGGCGSEGRYEWDGFRFTLAELRWRDCESDEVSLGPPYPVIWPRD